MKKYSSNYCTVNNSYIISFPQENNRIKDDNTYSSLCVVQNIIQRGAPTRPSSYLISEIGDYSTSNVIRYFSTSPNYWDKTIKGHDVSNDNPALELFKNILPSALDDWSFITSLMLPEAKINDITGIENEAFVNQQVDFYLSQCKLVIEVDGMQHNEEIATQIDKERDEYLAKHDIETLRITAKEIKDYIKGSKVALLKKLTLITNKCKQSQELNYIKQTPDMLKSKPKVQIYDGIIRFQILVLELLKSGVISLTDDEWKFNILNQDVKIPYEIAIQDIKIWLTNILGLQNKSLNDIKITIRKVGSFKNHLDDGVNVDFSLLKRWDDSCNLENVCYVRSDYFNERDYFEVATGELIRYDIVLETEENSNIRYLYNLNKDIFGFDEFNKGQIPIIINALSLTDTIGLLPTGGGKSLCYQLCCMLQPTINFVVVPIKSLMLDQKQNLDKKGIVHTEFINSDMEGDQKGTALTNFAHAKYFYVWISPERFQTEAFRKQLREINNSLNIGYAVIDEVHCMSEWGHDFRTSYLHLVHTIRSECPAAIFLGLTATASKNVLKDILVEFEVDDSCIKTILDYTRPELQFKILTDDNGINRDKKQNLINLLGRLNNTTKILDMDGEKSKCGIVFMPHVNGEYGCHKLAQDFNANPLFKGKVAYYSGQVPKVYKKPIMDNESFNKYKSDVQSKFQNNEFPILFATKAFGMGIDKQNIRYTVHYGVPESVEAYYQEAGRAGRDKKPAVCYILYSKDTMSPQEYNELFDINTTIDQLNAINASHPREAADVFRNLFLSLQGNKSVEDECKLIVGMYNYFCTAKKSYITNKEVRQLGLVDEKEMNMNGFGIVQKAIYRLSCLGVIDDWTIEAWNSNGKFRIYYGNLELENIKESLERFIQKYDIEFNFDNLKLSRYKKYDEIWHRGDLDELSKYVLILLQWNYDNIFYSRRESQKNLIELCNTYYEKARNNNEKEAKAYFKEALEGFFKITEETYILDSLVTEPDNVQTLTTLIVDEDGALKSKEEFRKIKTSLVRYLESYRYNTALNYLSGICGMVLDEYDVLTKERFKTAFVSINEKNDEHKAAMFELSLNVGKQFNDKGKEEMSDMLNNFYNKKYQIYEILKDNTSLGLILGEQLSKLEKIGDKLNGGRREA